MQGGKENTKGRPQTSTHGGLITFTHEVLLQHKRKRKPSYTGEKKAKKTERKERISPHLKPYDLHQFVFIFRKSYSPPPQVQIGLYLIGVAAQHACNMHRSNEWHQATVIETEVRERAEG